MTLHKAIKQVLEENKGKSMTPQEIADELNRKGLYQKRDGTEIKCNQVSARISNHRYRHMFNRNVGIISLSNNKKSL
jgi:hypothetical protein